MKWTPKWRSKRLAGPAIILLAAAVAIGPLVERGPSCGEDFRFHFVSWLDAQNSWRQGIPYPHWTPDANFGAGEPRFVFYPPLSWMLGAALGSVLSWQLVPAAVIFLLLAATGLATWALARESLPEGASILAGCAAIFSPYALFNAFERTDFAELAGGLWIPMLLVFILRGRKPSEPAFPTPAWRRAFDGSTAPLALAVAGAWLSNPTVGVMACYLLAAVALTRALLEWSWAPVLRATAGAVVGMGLVAAYLIPASWEQRWVDILAVTRVPEQRLENNWLFAVHADPALGPHDSVLHRASIIAVVQIAVALGGLLASWLRGRLPGERRWWIPLALVPVTVLFLQFPVSRPLWNLLPGLRFLQFPWRWLLVLEAPMAIFFASAVWPGNSRQPWRRVAIVSACIAVFLAMTAFAALNFFRRCNASLSEVALSVMNHGSVWGMPEYAPIGARNELVAIGLPDACLVSNPSAVLGRGAEGSLRVWNADQGSCEATFAAAPNPGQARAEHLRIQGVTDYAGFLILRLRSYPAWRVRVNGRELTGLPRRDDGLMAVPVPEGAVDLAVDWTATPDVIAGRWLSGLAALLLTGLWWMERRLQKDGQPRLS
jgi:hypothetical protein